MSQEEQIQWFENLFTTYGDAIFRHLAYKLGDRERAKELTQEVFMRTWQQIVAGKVIEHEKAFLYTIARNLFVNDIRTDKTSTSLDTLAEVYGFESAAGETGPELQSEQLELKRHLAGLKAVYREVLELRFVDGLSVKDIAQTLGEKETTISMRIARATESLRQLYTKGKE